MRIVDLADGAASIVLDVSETAAMQGRWVDVMAWASETLPDGQDGPWSLEEADGLSTATFRDRPSALAFLGRFLPGSLAELARGLEAVCGDYHEVAEKDGAVYVDIRYVGDAGGGEVEPHDQTWEDSGTYAEAARELGFDVEPIHSDHDTISVRLTPALAARPEVLPAP